nr:2-phospho-L-lactate guanylyltransferase [Saccharopolyspora sp. HNM0983]
MLVPIKPLHAAKSRLRGAADGGRGSPRAHADLVAAVALDTMEAARQADGVQVVMVSSDPELTGIVAAAGVPVLPDVPAAGLNPALRCAESALRAQERVRRIGALHGDLPALRPAELTAALRAAGEDRAFCPDRHGTGTTLLLAAAGDALDPAFGPGSARAHARSGARRLDGPWPSVRCDVDTAADLRAARSLGLGPRTASLPAAD